MRKSDSMGWSPKHFKDVHGGDFGLHNKVVRKTLDEIVQNNTLQDDDELFFAVGATEIWYVKAIIFLHSGTTPDFKYSWTVPANGRLQFWDHVQIAGGGGADWLSTYNEGITGINKGSSGNIYDAIIAEAIYWGGGTAGNLQLQWAQRTTNASDTKVLTNSCIIATLIG